MSRGKGIVLAVALLIAGIARGQDIVKIAPKDVKVLLNNSQVRMFEVSMKKGEKIGMHSHPTPYVLYALTPVKVRFTLPDKSTSELEMKAGEAHWSNGGIHSQEALEDSRALVMELKKARTGKK
jgi:beta-alanine degradation protein BauB